MEDQAIGDRNARVLRLLATWEAVADPSLADIVAVVAHRRRVARAPSADAVRALRAAADHPGAALPTELRGEIESVLEDLRGDRAGAASAARLREVLPRVRRHLADRVGAETSAVGEDLRAWVLGVKPEQRAEMLAAFWATAAAGTIPDLLGSLESLQRIRGGLADCRRQAEAELRELAEGGGNASVRSRAGAALASGAAPDLAAAWISLRGERGVAGAADAEEELSRQRRQLAERCDRLEEQAGPGPIETILAGARQLLATEDAGASPAARLDAVGRWIRCLDAAAEADDAGDRHAEVVEALRQALAAGGPEAGPVPDSLLQAGPGETAFQSALEGALEALPGASNGAAGGAADRLRDAARALETFLAKAAAQLPTGLVVDARQALLAVEPLVAKGDDAALVAHREGLEERLRALQGIQEQVRRQGRSDTEARRARAEEELERLRRAARGGEVKSLDGIAAEVRQASGEDLVRMEERIEQAEERIGGRLRRAAGRALRAATRRFPEGGKGAARDGADEVHELTARVRAALGGELHALQEATAALRDAVHRHAPWSRPARRLVLLLVLVAAVAGAGVALRFRPAPSYNLTLQIEPRPAGPVNVLLVQDGAVVREGPFDPAVGRAAFTLPGGRYEIYVDDRYTGLRVTLPEDEGDRVVRLPAGTP